MEITRIAPNLVRLQHNGYCYFLLRKHGQWMPFHPLEPGEHGCWSSLKDALKQTRQQMKPDGTGRLLSRGSSFSYCCAALCELGLYEKFLGAIPSLDSIRESNLQCRIETEYYLIGSR